MLAGASEAQYSVTFTLQPVVSDPPPAQRPVVFRVDGANATDAWNVIIVRSKAGPAPEYEPEPDFSDPSPVGVGLAPKYSYEPDGTPVYEHHRNENGVPQNFEHNSGLRWAVFYKTENGVAVEKDRTSFSP